MKHFLTVFIVGCEALLSVSGFAEGAMMMAHSIGLANATPGVFDGIRHKDPVGPRPRNGEDYRPIVALVIRKKGSKGPLKENEIFSGCSGTIIDQEYVITAGHCKDVMKEDEEYHVFIGETVYGKEPVAVLTHLIRKESYPEYDKDMDTKWLEGKVKMYNRNDIAVGKLSRKVPKEYSFTRVNLPRDNELLGADEELGQSVQAVGYGLMVWPHEEKAFADGTKVTESDFKRDPRKYVGNRSNGEVRVPHEDGALIPNNPVLQGRMHYVLPGDSGGALIAKGKDGRPVLVAVNAFKNYRGWGAQKYRQSVAVSTRYQSQFINETLDALKNQNTTITSLK